MGNKKLSSSKTASTGKEGASLLPHFNDTELPFYKLELKVRKNYNHFLKFLEEEIKKEAFTDFKVKKSEHKVSFFYTTKGRIFFRSKIEVKIKVKRTDRKNFHLSLRGKPVSYAYSNPERYINKLLLRILSSRS